MISQPASISPSRNISSASPSDLTASTARRNRAKARARRSSGKQGHQGMTVGEHRRPPERVACSSAMLASPRWRSCSPISLPRRPDGPAACPAHLSLGKDIGEGPWSAVSVLLARCFRPENFPWACAGLSAHPPVASPRPPAPSISTALILVRRGRRAIVAQPARLGARHPLIRRASSTVSLATPGGARRGSGESDREVAFPARKEARGPAPPKRRHRELAASLI